MIKLDFELKIAAVTEDFSEKEKLAQRNYDTKSIKLYRFEDDVLQLLQEGKESTITTQELNSRIMSTFDPNAATYCTNCDKIKCSLNSNIEGVTFNGGNNFTYRLESKHVYQKVAIYFRLFSESKYMRRPSGSFLTWNSESTTLYIWYDVKFKSKKSGSSEIFLVNSTNIFSNQLKPEYYVSSRGLEKYWVKSQFFGEVGGNHGYSPTGDYWQFNLCDIKDGY
ncbi:hypothetical protein [Rhodonellum ikkaensis]|uniref:hypothetical protein n=1 Tax=Rhodonellum ikkaensis TaxID=336829 RepID=UPI0011137D86|nr:hypothetical protein [Rhodonellum ikkaensis]